MVMITRGASSGRPAGGRDEHYALLTAAVDFPAQMESRKPG